MTLEQLAVAELAQAVAELSGLPLMHRYGIGQKAFSNMLRGALSRGEGLLCAKDEHGRIVGLAWYLPRGGLGVGGYLRLLLVVPKAMGQGVGSALLAGFEAGCPGAHAGHFVLTETPDGAAAFYERHGYRPVGPLPDFVRKGQTELLLWKRP